MTGIYKITLFVRNKYNNTKNVRKMFSSIKDKKLKQILFAAKDLFWKYGIKRVTIEEVCSEANVSKMTFYKHFKNKIELVVKVYETIVEESWVKYRKLMDSNISFENKIQGIFKLKREGVQDLSKEFYADLLKSDIPEIQNMIQKAMKKNFQIFINDLNEAQKKGEVRKDIKPEFIMYFINHMIEMANDTKLSALYSNPEELIMELNKFFFYGVLPRS